MKAHLPEKLYMVIPCYNEQEVLPETSRRLADKLSALIEKGAIAPDSKVLFVDDGSKDNTWAIIEEFHQKNPLFSGVRLSRNRGHQNALVAGLMTAKDRADIVISMDADLQDDIETIDGFLAQRAAGCEIVYGVRDDRSADTAFKRITAVGYYKFMRFLGMEIIHNHADFRLTSRRVLEELEKFSEVNLFLRGIIPLIGYKTAIVTYKRAERFAGETKYPLRKMLALAFDGITSFSVKPIKFITNTGILLTAFSVLMSIYSLLARHFAWAFLGWGALMGSLWFLAGVQLAAIGVVGSYVGKVYGETKRRPRYMIDQILEQPHERKR